MHEKQSQKTAKCCLYLLAAESQSSHQVNNRSNRHVEKRNPKENATHLTYLGLGNGTQSCKTYDRVRQAFKNLNLKLLRESRHYDTKKTTVNKTSKFSINILFISVPDTVKPRGLGCKQP